MLNVLFQGIRTYLSETKHKDVGPKETESNGKGENGLRKKFYVGPSRERDPSERTSSRGEGNNRGWVVLNVLE